MTGDPKIKSVATKNAALSLIKDDKKNCGKITETHCTPPLENAPFLGIIARCKCFCIEVKANALNLEQHF